MFFKTSDNFNLRYEVQASKLKQDVLFIHGNLASSEWWFPTMEVLKTVDEQETSKMVAADWRGYGLSKGIQNKSEIDFEKFATDFIELADHLNLKNIRVVGHSTGGLIALMAYLKKPELFSSLILLDSVGAKGLEHEQPVELILAHFNKMSEDKNYFDLVYGATIQNVDKESSFYKQIFDITLNSDKAMWVGAPEVLFKDVDITEKMPSVHLPTLILHGEFDVVLPLKGSELLHKQIKNSEFKKIPNAGHSFNVENPEAFSDFLTEFWKKH